MLLGMLLATQEAVVQHLKSDVSRLVRIKLPTLCLAVEWRYLECEGSHIPGLKGNTELNGV